MLETGAGTEEDSKFLVECHEGSLISLKGTRGYVTAEPNGKLRGNRGVLGAWEVFLVKDRSGKGAKTCRLVF